MLQITKHFFAAFALLFCVGAGSFLASPVLADTPAMSGTKGFQPLVELAPVDINSATAKELRSLPGIGKSYSKKIIEGRPYQSVEELKTRKVLPKKAYSKIQGMVVTKTKK